MAGWAELAPPIINRSGATTLADEVTSPHVYRWDGKRARHGACFEGAINLLGKQVGTRKDLPHLKSWWDGAIGRQPFRQLAAVTRSSSQACRIVSGSRGQVLARRRRRAHHHQRPAAGCYLMLQRCNIRHFRRLSDLYCLAASQNETKDKCLDN